MAAMTLSLLATLLIFTRLLATSASTVALASSPLTTRVMLATQPPQVMSLTLSSIKVCSHRVSLSVFQVCGDEISNPNTSGLHRAKMPEKARRMAI